MASTLPRARPSRGHAPVKVWQRSRRSYTKLMPVRHADRHDPMTGRSRVARTPRSAARGSRRRRRRGRRRALRRVLGRGRPRLQGPPAAPGDGDAAPAPASRVPVPGPEGVPAIAGDPAPLQPPAAAAGGRRPAAAAAHPAAGLRRVVSAPVTARVAGARHDGEPSSSADARAHAARAARGRGRARGDRRCVQPVPRRLRAGSPSTPARGRPVRGVPAPARGHRGRAARRRAHRRPRRSDRRRARSMLAGYDRDFAPRARSPARRVRAARVPGWRVVALDRDARHRARAGRACGSTSAPPRRRSPPTAPRRARRRGGRRPACSSTSAATSPPRAPRPPAAGPCASPTATGPAPTRPGRR